jgi:hypothetical protein
MLLEQRSGSFGRPSLGDVVTKSRQGSAHAVPSGFFVINYH